MNFKKYIKDIILYYALGFLSLVVAYISLSTSKLTEWSYESIIKSPESILFIVMMVFAWIMSVIGTAGLLLLSKKK